MLIQSNSLLQFGSLLTVHSFLTKLFIFHSIGGADRFGQAVLLSKEIDRTRFSEVPSFRSPLLSAPRVGKDVNVSGNDFHPPSFSHLPLYSSSFQPRTENADYDIRVKQ